jgi:hypothetical protein
MLRGDPPRLLTVLCWLSERVVVIDTTTAIIKQ